MLRPAHFLALPVLLFVATSAASAAVDFAREVQPILAENCLHCHGPDAKDRKAGLRLDTREGALHGGKSGVPTIVEKNPADATRTPEEIVQCFRRVREEIRRVFEAYCAGLREAPACAA
jgi:mono/diheme cytochrome c family protein